MNENLKSQILSLVSEHADIYNKPRTYKLGDKISIITEQGYIMRLQLYSAFK